MYKSLTPSISPFIMWVAAFNHRFVHQITVLLLTLFRPGVRLCKLFVLRKRTDIDCKLIFAESIMSITAIRQSLLDHRCTRSKQCSAPRAEFLSRSTALHHAVCNKRHMYIQNDRCHTCHTKPYPPVRCLHEHVV